MATSLEPYNPQWKTEFESLKRELERSLGDLNQYLTIEHIGSTSLPGLSAKPILDIDIIIEDTSLLHKIEKILITLGYVSRGEQGIPGRFAFRQKSDLVPFTDTKRKWQTHHLYVCYANSLALKNHLLFRDALRRDETLLQRYAELKKRLIDDVTLTREDYTTQKTDFILSVLTQAGLSEKELEAIAKSNR